jgi:hypothetical protein
MTCVAFDVARPSRSGELIVGSTGQRRTDQGNPDSIGRRAGVVCHKWSMPMWILMYVFSYSVSPAATNDRAEWRLLPTVVFQEFSNEERCRAAKSKLEDSLKEAGAKLRSGLEDLKSIGKADPNQIIIAFNVECLPK